MWGGMKDYTANSLQICATCSGYCIQIGCIDCGASKFRNNRHQFYGRRRTYSQPFAVLVDGSVDKRTVDSKSLT